MPLKLNSSGGGSVTVQEPSTASNVTFNLPSETATAIYSNASGNVGIGTSSPATKLQVNGTANGNAATIIGNASLTGSAPTNAGSIRLIDNPTASTAAGGIEFLTSTFGSGYGWKIASIDSSGVHLTFSTRQNSATWSESARIDSSGNFQFNSGYGSVAIAYGCRAWVNFNGTGTVAIRGSGNVSSITDNGTGNYTVNFTNAMPDANYGVNFGVGGGGSGLNASFVAGVLTSTQYGTASNKTTSVVQFTTGDYTSTLRDLGEIYVSVFR